MAKVVIIGAGLTGISTAYHLEKNGFFDYKIFEKEAQIGGLCKSVQQDGFTFDYTGHLLHINDPYFQELIKNIVNLDNFNLIDRKSFVYSHEKYTPYPYQTNLYGLPTNVIQDCICGFVDRKASRISKNNKIPIGAKLSGLSNDNNLPIGTKLSGLSNDNNLPIGTKLSGLSNDNNLPMGTKFSRLSPRRGDSPNPHSYYQWVLQNFGPGFGKHFFFPYQQKIFSYDVRKLSSSWTGRFVPKTSLENLISGSVEENKDAIGYNSKFYYPKNGGIFYLIKKFSQQLLNPIQTNFGVKTIDTTNKIVIFDNGHTEKYDVLINTMPLDNFLTSIKDTHSLQPLKSISSKLLCNSVVNFNLGIFSDKTYDKHWIYYPEKSYPFYRTGFFHNYSDNMAPKGCSSMYGEFSYIKKSKKFVSNKLDYCLQESKKILEINDKEILTEKVLHIKHAYVIYDMWREKNITKVHSALEQSNIYSIGRYGQWKYSSMQEAVLDGKQVVETLITNNFAQDKQYWKIKQAKIIKNILIK